jgi:hypothetical protein
VADEAVVPHRAAHLEAVEPRHGDVGEDEPGPLLEGEAQPFRAVRRLVDGEPPPRQHVLDVRPEDVVVVHDEHGPEDLGQALERGDGRGIAGKARRVVGHDLLAVEVELAELGVAGARSTVGDRGLDDLPALDHGASRPLAGHGEDPAPRLALHVLQERFDRPVRPHSGPVGEALEHAFDLLEQEVARERLRHVVHDAEAEGAHPLRELALRGEEDDRHAGGGGIGLQGLEDTVAVHPRHRDVAEHEVGSALPRELERVGGVPGGDDRVPSGHEEALDERADRVVVLDHQDLALGHDSSRTFRASGVRRRPSRPGRG